MSRLRFTSVLVHVLRPEHHPEVAHSAIPPVARDVPSLVDVACGRPLVVERIPGDASMVAEAPCDEAVDEPFLPADVASEPQAPPLLDGGELAGAHASPRMRTSFQDV